MGLGTVSVRNRMLKSLREEILGPRNGPNEVLESNPAFEYITGILEPKSFNRDSSSTTIEASEPKPVDVEYGEEDDEFDYDQLVPSPIGSAIDPRAFSKSLGISFAVKQLNPSISVCITFGTYEKSNQGFQRTPHFTVIPEFIPQDGDYVLYQDALVTLSCHRRMFESYSHISLYLCNTMDLPSNATYLSVEHLIFQPQIRVCCENKTSLVHVEARKSFSEDEKDFNLLFRKKRAYARGHMCSAVWKEEDPEREFDVENSSESPFSWIDGQSVSREIREKYSTPSLRTEYLPIYLIEQVDMSLQLGDPEIFSAEALSESWNYEMIQNRIEPLFAGYSDWIDKLEEEIRSSDDIDTTIAETNIEHCRDTLKRMQEGLETLRNPDARLSFCFMNKAIGMQYRWKSGDGNGGFCWRPFQIAFILSCLAGIIDKSHRDRKLCDVLWFPTGGGKTEAYLGLTAFVFAFRRRSSETSVDYGYGTAVISRYTLRLLTVQQFRRALNLVTACEVLRVQNWKPMDSKIDGNFLWGLSRFSVGLWVGSSVTPNRVAIDHPRAYSALTELVKGYGRSEPAQVTNCPACDSILSVTGTTMDPKGTTLFLVVRSPKGFPAKPDFPKSDINVIDFKYGLFRDDHYWIRLTITTTGDLKGTDLDEWWNTNARQALNDCEILSTRPSRPGYFLRLDPLSGRRYDFEIRCPNPDCELNQLLWYELEPSSQGPRSRAPIPIFQSDKDPSRNIEMQKYSFSRRILYELGMPIPAYTCDDQIYHRLPTMIVATADKFARLPFEARSASIFGNIDSFDTVWGFHRRDLPPRQPEKMKHKIVKIDSVDPPELMIQDELHLINGPLGSLVGLYEIAIESLASRDVDGELILPKYIASSATIRHANSQVKAIFNRTIQQFPPKGIDIADNYFSKESVSHPVISKKPGRIYVGVCAPGKGAQTPVVRIWAALMQRAYVEKLDANDDNEEVDQFWTNVGYFNALRELANVRALYRQDIVSRIESIAGRYGHLPRNIDETRAIELSSQMNSAEVPRALKRLERFPANEVDALLATSMFGTGVDVSRLGLMTVHGQPKTTSNYIQATGRVGRKRGGLVITLLRATRPRDLDHYEFFVGYHQQMQRYVEPITVYPFSPRAMDRAIGPIGVSILRNSINSNSWASDTKKPPGSVQMAKERPSSVVNTVEQILYERSSTQPAAIQPRIQDVMRHVASEMDNWQSFAKRHSDLVYVEYQKPRTPLEKPVVLGDPEHEAAKLPVVYRNAPQSLREVEPTTRFG